MQKSELPTLEDVARLAEVSTATVSRCLNAPNRVAKETRERVLAAVKTLHYSPNFGARALAARKTNTFGAVIPTMENAIFARGLQAFEEELVRKGATLLVASSFYDPEIERQQIHNLISRGAEGLLLIGDQRDEDVYAFLDDREVPYVLAWAYPRHREKFYVGFDNYAAAKALTERAISLGHRDFAFISAERKDNDRARERVLGTLKALNEAGISPNAMPIVETTYAIENGAVAFRQIMSAKKRPTIVLCGNDVLAVGAIRAARELGINVPGDVSITGFDDIELANVVTPALTTVHVPHREMGRRAASSLLQMTRGQTPQVDGHLDTYIVERESLSSVKT